MHSQGGVLVWNILWLGMLVPRACCPSHKLTSSSGTFVGFTTRCQLLVVSWHPLVAVFACLYVRICECMWGHHPLTHTHIAAPVPSCSPNCHSMQGNVYLYASILHTRLVQKQVRECVWSPVNLHLSQSDWGISSSTRPLVALLFVVPTYLTPITMVLRICRLYFTTVQSCMYICLYSRCVIISMCESRVQHFAPTGVALEFGLSCVKSAGDGNHWWFRGQCLYVPGTVPLQMPTILFQPHRPLEVWI